MGNAMDWWRKPALLVLVIASVGVAACSDSDEEGDSPSQDSAESTTTRESSSSTPDGVQRQPEGQASFFSIDEVIFGPDAHVVVRNITDIDVSIDRLHVCQGEECSAIPDEVVPADGVVILAIGSAPPREGVALEKVNLGALNPSDGEVAIYVSDPDDPTRIVNYLEWGSTPHPRAADAIERGIWLEGTYAPSGDDAVRLYRNPDSGLWLWETA